MWTNAKSWGSHHFPQFICTTFRSLDQNLGQGHVVYFTSVPTLSYMARNVESLLIVALTPISCPEAILVDEMRREMSWLTNKGPIMPIITYRKWQEFLNLRIAPLKRERKKWITPPRWCGFCRILKHDKVYSLLEALKVDVLDPLNLLHSPPRHEKMFVLCP